MIRPDLSEGDYVRYKNGSDPWCYGQMRGRNGIDPDEALRLCLRLPGKRDYNLVLYESDMPYVRIDNLGADPYDLRYTD